MAVMNAKVDLVGSSVAWVATASILAILFPSVILAHYAAAWIS
jgi:hypothetical protein